MEFFTSYDGTKLAYRVIGDGRPVICLPGGPQESAYLGELGGLSAHRQLIMLDLRGTGRSATPADIASCRCDRLVDDVEALRGHLGLDRMDLLAHSAGANLAVQYVGRRPERVGRLALITPSVRAVGIAITGELRRETVQPRRDEPWFPEAFAALEAIGAGQATADSRQAIAPFSYGRWDEAARAHRAAEDERMNTEVVAAFNAEGAYDPDATRAALARFQSPVLLLAGEVDPGAPAPATAEFAELFPNAEFAVQPGAGHFPWLDDADRFVAATAAFLGQATTRRRNLSH
ncbi:alpha/beta fold hydrolase [Streptomyces chiangmaiensis]|uniref:Alpha/beta hydrolase n=1 Tax=Streptomyces chiangmaiensis TaxID=766497 RepID=A0ABU7FE67_9ACTN|nr:alpha/beta hydrolase [Streptomyces chiangmaiensis]MED7821658.1 alpha/beta hydrolase [Streptomyces chiangmaiensis]